MKRKTLLERVLVALGIAFTPAAALAEIKKLPSLHPLGDEIYKLSPRAGDIVVCRGRSAYELDALVRALPEGQFEHVVFTNVDMKLSDLRAWSYPRGPWAVSRGGVERSLYDT